jgi:hypothetical protein
MKPPYPLPVKCDVCETCICYCARTYELAGEPSEEEIKELSSDIEEIKRREEYLRGLRTYLESRIQRHVKVREIRANDRTGIV